VHRVDPDVSQIEAWRCPPPLLSMRRVLDICRHGASEGLVFSALGVREGLLYSLLTPRSAEDRDRGRQRAHVLALASPAHGQELITWTDASWPRPGLGDRRERRLRHAPSAGTSAARHPTSRRQSLNIIANAAFSALIIPAALISRLRCSCHVGD